MDLRLVEELHVLGRAVLAAEHLDEVLLDRLRLVLNRQPLVGEMRCEKAFPLTVGEGHAVEPLDLRTQVGDKLALGANRQIGVALLAEDRNEALLQRRLALVQKRIAVAFDGSIAPDDRITIRFGNERVVYHVNSRIDILRTSASNTRQCSHYGMPPDR